MEKIYLFLWKQIFLLTVVCLKSLFSKVPQNTDENVEIDELLGCMNDKSENCIVMFNDAGIFFFW